MTKIPQERKALYYIGTGLMVLGFILFISVFFTAISVMNNFMSSPFSSMNTMGTTFGRAIIGMIFIGVGGMLKNIGARGAAGSGVILDPERAREDLRPYTEAAGGMINDVISNIDVPDKLKTQQDENEVIKIRCKNCKSLNDEDAKFCKNCGMEL